MGVVVVQGRDTILGSKVPTAVCYHTRDDTRGNTMVSSGWETIYLEGDPRVMNDTARLQEILDPRLKFLWIKILGGPLSSAFYKGMNSHSPANSFLGGLDSSRR